MNQGRVTVDTFTEPPPSAAGYQHQEVPRKQSGSLRDQQPRGPLPPDPIGIPSTSIDPQSPNHYVAWGSPCPLWASGSSGLSDGGLSQAMMVPPPSPRSLRSQCPWIQGTTLARAGQGPSQLDSPLDPQQRCFSQRLRQAGPRHQRACTAGALMQSLVK